MFRYSHHGPQIVHILIDVRLVRIILWTEGSIDIRLQSGVCIRIGEQAEEHAVQGG